MNGSGTDQYGQAPYPDPSGGGPSSDAIRRVQGPAIALIIVAAIGICLQILGLIVRLLGIGMAGMMGGGREGMPMFAALAGTLGMVLGLLGALIGIVIIVGALKMKALRSYGLAMAAAILVMIPCVSPCCILGLPVGIWALVVLVDPNVKASFRP